MWDEAELKHIVEALLMSSDEPLTIDKMISAFESTELPSREQLQMALDALKIEYATRAIELNEVASGYRLQTRDRYRSWVVRLLAEKPTKYSSAFLEVLAIIAYRQPVTRGDIEDARGVAVSHTMLKTLLEREWIRIAGHRDVPGKPAVYVTTKGFLDYFNLVSLHDLPQGVLKHEQ